MAGVHMGVLPLGRLAIQLEVDYIAQRREDSHDWTHQLASYVELDLLLLKGLSLRVSHDYHDANLNLTGERRQRFTFGVDLFVLPMVEAKVFYALKQSEAELAADTDDRLEVALHVFY